MNEDTSVSETTETAEVTESTEAEESSRELVERLVEESHLEPGEAPAAPAKPREAKEAQRPRLTIEQLEVLAKTGKVSDLLDALGADKSQMDIPSKKFAALKKGVARVNAAKQEFEALTAAQKQELSAHEGQLQQFAQRLQDEYAPIHQVKTLIDRGEFTKAIQVMTGGKMSLLDFARRAAEEEAVADPVARAKLDELREQLEVERKEKETLRQQEEARQQQLARQQEAQRASKGMTFVSGLLETEGGMSPDIARHPSFVSHVYEAARKELAAGWKPTDEVLKAEIIEYAKQHLLALRQGTAMLHRDPTGSHQPTGEQVAETAARGNRGPIRRATPKLKPEIEQESARDTVDRLFAETYGR